MPEREPLSGADNAWRRLGTTDNLTTITGILSFSEKLSYEELCDQLERRVLRFDRFTQRLGGRKRRFRRPYWESVDDFDIDTHVYEINLPRPRNRVQLQQFVGRLMSRPLDERRPLWEAYHIQEYDGGSAVVFRLHHSLADGFALMYVLFGLADNPGDIEFPLGALSAPDPPEEENDGGRETAEANGGVRTEQPADPIDTPNSGSGDDSRTDTDTKAPTGAVTAARDGIKLAGTALRAGAGMLLQSDEPQTSLHCDIGTTKRAAWTDELDLATVKAIGDSHDATVNDVLLAATAGVFRETLADRGEETDGLVLRCTVPVNLKPMARRDESLGNYFGMAFVPIPVGVSDFAERIQFIRERTDVTRLGIEAYLMYQTLQLGGYVPEPVFDAALQLFEDNATAVVSNVPGPVDSIEIAGKEVDKILFWNPQAVDQGLSVSIFSYDGGVRVGVSGDANVVPEPERLADRFEDEILAQSIAE